MSRNNTIRTVLFEAKKALKECGVSEYALDAEIFMMKAVSMDRTGILINGDYELTDEQLKSFNAMIKRRQMGEPSQYILGKCEFMGYEFFVNENVLVPRPDTEVLVETVIEKSKEHGFKSVLDMCTGSGCIAVSLACLGIESLTASDISQGALNMAIKNAEYNNVSEKIQFVKSDVFESIDRNRKFDAIVSNPPYIPTEDIAYLMREVKEHEPLNALDGGSDGLDFYRKITSQSRGYLNDGGYLFYEIGYDQSQQLHSIMRENGFDGVTTVKDYAGLDRVVFGFKRRDTDVV